PRLAPRARTPPSPGPRLAAARLAAGPRARRATPVALIVTSAITPLGPTGTGKRPAAPVPPARAAQPVPPTPRLDLTAARLLTARRAGRGPRARAKPPPILRPSTTPWGATARGSRPAG